PVSRSCAGSTVRRAWRETPRRRGAMLVPSQGRREPAYQLGTWATEDAVEGASSAALRLSGFCAIPSFAAGRVDRADEHLLPRRGLITVGPLARDAERGEVLRRDTGPEGHVAAVGERPHRGG